MNPTMICLNPITKQEKLKFFPKVFTSVVTAAAISKFVRRKYFVKERNVSIIIFFLGTLKSARGRGFCSEVNKTLSVNTKYFKRVEADGLPMWLEAGIEYAMNNYQTHGFVVVDQCLLARESCK